jgi:hypothetical protein
MALARWTPMGNLKSFQDEMNRMFNQFFRGGNGEEAGCGVRTAALAAALKHPPPSKNPSDRSPGPAAGAPAAAGGTVGDRPTPHRAPAQPASRLESPWTASRVGRAASLPVG